MSDPDAAVVARCMHGPVPNPCNSIAEWHVRVTEPEGDVYLLECQQHFRWWLSRDAQTDYHRIDHKCILPSSLWNESRGINGDGFCSIDWGKSIEVMNEPLVAAS